MGALIEQPNLPGLPIRSTALTPLDLLQIAVQNGTSMDQLERLMDLRDRWEASEAKKAFITSLNAFKQNPPQVIKNKAVDFGNTHYKYATLDSVCAAIIDGLSAVGISHRWKVEQSTDPNSQWIRVTCILTHEMGHSEETSLIGNPDTSGSKNAIQAVGSAVTYLQRYTLLSATGLAAANGDDDGRSSGAPVGPKMDPCILGEHLEFMENASSREELEKLFRNGYAEAKKLGDQNAMKAIISKKDKEKGRF